MGFIEVHGPFIRCFPLNGGQRSPMTVAQPGVYPQRPGRRWLNPVYPDDPALSRKGLLLETDHQAIAAGIEPQHVVRFGGRTIETATLTDGIAMHPAVAAQILVGMQMHVLSWWTRDPSVAPRAVIVDTLTKVRLSGLNTA